MSAPKYADKDRNIAIILAVLLGGFGVHKFYLEEMKKGGVYLIFFWTAIPLLLGFYDAYKYATNREEFGTNTKSTTDTVDNEDETPELNNRDGVPENAIKVAEGVNGRVTLYDDRLEISREGIGMIHKMQHGFKGDKEMPYASITSVQLRKPSSVTRGYIQFGQSGFSESDDGILDATSDENTVLFDKKSLSEFEELRTEIRELKSGDVEEKTGTMDGALEKLRERYAKGDIDEDEYEKRKKILQQG